MTLLPRWSSNKSRTRRNALQIIRQSERFCSVLAIGRPYTAAMHTADECRAIAQAKLDEANSNPRPRKSLTDAAEAWLLLAARIEETPAFDFDGRHPS